MSHSIRQAAVVLLAASLPLLWLGAAAPLPTPPPAPLPEIAAGPAPSAAHLASARKVYDLMAPGTSIIDSMLAGFDSSMTSARQRGAPEAAITEMRAAAKEFFTKLVTSGEVQDGAVSMLARVYTQPELEEIAKFMSSDVGKKMTANMPRIQQEGFAFAQQIIARHQQELMATFSAIAAKYGQK